MRFDLAALSTIALAVISATQISAAPSKYDGKYDVHRYYDNYYHGGKHHGYGYFPYGKYDYGKKYYDHDKKYSKRDDYDDHGKGGEGYYYDNKGYYDPKGVKATSGDFKNGRGAVFVAPYGKDGKLVAVSGDFDKFHGSALLVPQQYKDSGKFHDKRDGGYDGKDNDEVSFVSGEFGKKFRGSAVVAPGYDDYGKKGDDHYYYGGPYYDGKDSGYAGGYAGGYKDGKVLQFSGKADGFRGAALVAPVYGSKYYDQGYYERPYGYDKKGDYDKKKDD